LGTIFPVDSLGKVPREKQSGGEKKKKTVAGHLETQGEKRICYIKRRGWKVYGPTERAKETGVWQKKALCVRGRGLYSHLNEERQIGTKKCSRFLKKKSARKEEKKNETEGIGITLNQGGAGKKMAGTNQDRKKNLMVEERAGENREEVKVAPTEEGKKSEGESGGKKNAISGGRLIAVKLLRGLLKNK